MLSECVEETILKNVVCLGDDKDFRDGKRWVTTSLGAVRCRAVRCITVEDLI